MEIYYINRKSGKKEKEIVAGEKFLRWIHDTKLGNNVLEMVIKRKLFSFLYGKWQDLPISRGKIASFVESLGIDMQEAEIEDLSQYRNFNEFFARRLKPEARPICKDLKCIISPADGRILAYENIDINRIVQIKGNDYTLAELLGDRKLAQEYAEGICVIVRLCPADYHRYHFPDSGVAQRSMLVKGYYYSVNPIALKKVARVYCENKREITIFMSDHFGKMILIEVGATCVGSIVQTYQAGQRVEKGQEKGYFKFGGSTVVMLLKKGNLRIDEDIIQNTQNGIETKVNMGERIGKIK